MASNAVIDASGRLAARKGVLRLTGTAIAGTPVVRTLFEYAAADGAVVPIVAWDGGIASSVTDPVGNDISGSVTDASGNWWFQNFNNKLVGFQEGQKAIVFTGAGTFAPVAETSGVAPQGGVGTAAFGRIWQADLDRTTIKYSGLLDESAWDAGGAGIIDMRNIWTQGTDTITAIVGFNGALIVFGTNHVVFFVDGRGTALGIDPDNLYVSDIIGGVGCVSQHSVQAVGEADLLFLSGVGVQSLKRLQNERSSPISNLTKYVRDELVTKLTTENPAGIRSSYNELYGFYLLSFPEAGVTWVLDQRKRYRDVDGDECSIVTTWGIAPTALYSRRSNALLLSISGGVVGRYLGDNDLGVDFTFEYKSPWLDLGEDFANRLKMLKRLGAILFVRAGAVVTFKWATDFSEVENSITRTIAGTAGSEWNVAEYGLGEWGSGINLSILKVPARDRGQYYRVGLSVNVSSEFAIQQQELFVKIGRLA
jgi:hypothetical protein